MNSLLLQKVSKTLECGEDILKNINLQFIEGKRYCIFGPSGCGKTTLLNIISGSDENYTGAIFYNEINIKDVESIEENSYKRYIVTHIKQDNILFDNLTKDENINLPLIGTNNIDFGKEKGKVKTLSGGQYKQVSIDQALNKETKILLVDEPTSNLDKKSSKAIMNRLMGFCKDKILIFVTHDKDIAENYSDEIIELNDGKCKKNYKKRIKGDDFTLGKPPHILKRNKRMLSKTLFKRNSNYTGLFNQNLICLLISFGVLISIFLGIKKFFNDQLNFAQELTYISIKQPNFYGNIDGNDIELIKEITGQVNFKEKYKYEKTIDITICNIPLKIESEIITTHNETYNKHLDEETVILKCNENYKALFEKCLGIENFDDYFDNQINYIDFIINGEIKEFQIFDILFSENESSIKLIHSDPNFYKNLWNNNEYVWTIDKDFITKELIEYLNLSKNYFLIDCSEYYEIYKSNYQLLDNNKLNNISMNNILVFEDGPFILHENNGIYYFDNFRAIKDNKISSGIIYYTPYKNSLEMGRFAVEDNEISISTVLAKELGINEPGLIKLEHNYTSEYYFVTGIFEADDKYIYQSPKWINILNENYKEANLKPKSLSAVFFIEPNKVEETINQLKDLYPDAYIYSPVVETISVIKNSTNKILGIGSIFIGLLFIISIFAIYLVTKIEIESMKKPIEHVSSMGFDKKDFNSILKRLLYRRSILSFTLSQIIIIILVTFTNKIIEVQMGLGENLLVYNFLIPSSILIISISIVILVYQLLKYRKRKPKA